MDEHDVGLVKWVVICIAVIALCITAAQIFGGATGCARGCGDGRMSKWSASAQGVVEQCQCEERR